MGAITSINPATGETLKTFQELSDTEIQQKLERAESSFTTWRSVSLDERAQHMLAIAAHLKENVDKYAPILTTEMGKTIKEARAEIEKCVWNFEHYAEHGADYLKPRTVKTDASESYVCYEPLGVILMVMPWNYAFWQALRMAAPILMAGNTIVLKHASNVPQAALAIEDMLKSAGLPEGVFQTLLVGSSKIESIIENDIVKGVSLTGSEHAGSQVGAQAGKAIKPVVLELGGSDPSIILEDADLQNACTQVTTSRLMNNGQSCIGSKRFIVVAAVYDEFLAKLKDSFESYVLGDPMDEATMIGPVVSQDALDELLNQIERSVAAGAVILTGGKRRGTKGFFLEPTILTNVTDKVPSYHEELFGPVASVIKVADEKEAIKVANATRYGLGASIYTTDMARAKRLIPQIDAGSVFVNRFVKSDPRIPFGGIKKSGIGRELSEEGIKSFTNVKTVFFA